MMMMLSISFAGGGDIDERFRNETYLSNVISFHFSRRGPAIDWIKPSRLRAYPAPFDVVQVMHTVSYNASPGALTPGRI